MLLPLALIALLSTAHGCTVTIQVTKGANKDVITESAEVVVDEDLEITCTYNDESADSSTSCTDNKYQIGDETPKAYSTAVSYKLADVASIKFECQDPAATSVTFTLTNVNCADPEASTITAVLTLDTNKLKLVCNAESSCAEAKVDVVAAVNKDNAVVTMTKDITNSDRFKNTYLSADIATPDVKGYTGTCTYGAVAAKTAYYCPEDPTITRTPADVKANGVEFTVTCDFKSCTHTKFMVGNAEQVYSEPFKVANGVLTATTYKCMNGDTKEAEVAVGCMGDMTVVNTKGGICKTTKTPILCVKQTNGTYTKSCEEDITNDDSQCRCPASKPYYHVEDDTCHEKCGAQGMVVSVFLVVAAGFLRFL